MGLEWCTRTAVRYLMFGIWEHPTTEICPGSEICTAAIGCIQGMYRSADQRGLEDGRLQSRRIILGVPVRLRIVGVQLSAVEWLVLKDGVRF